MWRSLLFFRIINNNLQHISEINATRPFRLNIVNLCPWDSWSITLTRPIIPVVSNQNYQQAISLYIKGSRTKHCSRTFVFYVHKMYNLYKYNDVWVTHMVHRLSTQYLYLTLMVRNHMMWFFFINIIYTFLYISCICKLYALFELLRATSKGSTGHMWPTGRVFETTALYCSQTRADSAAAVGYCV